LIYVICIYRLPTGIFAHFIKVIDTILSQFSKSNTGIIICGDTIINYVDEICCKCQQQDALLGTYNLIGTV